MSCTPCMRLNVWVMWIVDTQGKDEVHMLSCLTGGGAGPCFAASSRLRAALLLGQVGEGAAKGVLHTAHKGIWVRDLGPGLMVAPA